MPTYVETVDETKPAGSRARSLGDDDIREYKRTIRERLATDHDFRSDETGITTIGYHKKVTFAEIQGAKPTAIANAGFLYLKDVDAVVELFWEDESGNELQITDVGELYNVVLLTGAQTIADVKTFSSFPITPSAAPTTDYQVANKKYVDDQSTQGAVLQVVNTMTGAVATGTTTMPYDDTIPQITEGDQFMSLAITPANTNNKLLLQVTFNATIAKATGEHLTVALFQVGTSNALAVANTRPEGGNGPVTVSFIHYMTAGSASEITFTVRAGSSTGGTTTFNGHQNGGAARSYGGVYASSITIMEIEV